MCDRPAYSDEVATNEIEITPEMMRAGVDAFYGYDSRDMEPESAVESIYLAMENRRRIASDKS